MKSILLLVLSALLAACAGNGSNTNLAIAPVPESDLLQVQGSHFDRFVVKDPAVFGGFDKVIIFAVQFDKLKISTAADKSLAKSWNSSNWDDMDTICQQFDDFALKIFKERDGFKPTDRGAENVLAMEFSLIKFMPFSKPYKEAGLDSVGTSSGFSGIGDVTIRAVLANAKTGELVGVIEDTMEVNANNASFGNLNMQMDGNNKMGQMLAWRKVFKRWVSSLHDELGQLKQQSFATAALKNQATQ